MGLTKVEADVFLYGYQKVQSGYLTCGAVADTFEVIHNNINLGIFIVTIEG